MEYLCALVVEFTDTEIPNVCGPVSGLVLSCQPEPFDFDDNFPSLAGFAATLTQASIVMLPVSWRSGGAAQVDVAAGSVERESAPVHSPGCPGRANHRPVRLFPDESFTVVPFRSSKPKAATNPGATGQGQARIQPIRKTMTANRTTAVLLRFEAPTDGKMHGNSLPQRRPKSIARSSTP